MMAFVSVKMVAVYRRQTVAVSRSVICRNPPSSSTDRTHACQRGVASAACPVSPEASRHMPACQDRGTAPREGSTPCGSCTCVCRTHTRVHGTTFVSDGGARGNPHRSLSFSPLRGARASRSVFVYMYVYTYTYIHTHTHTHTHRARHVLSLSLCIINISTLLRLCACSSFRLRTG